MHTIDLYAFLLNYDPDLSLETIENNVSLTFHKRYVKPYCCAEEEAIQELALVLDDGQTVTLDPTADIYHMFGTDPFQRLPPNQRWEAARRYCLEAAAHDIMSDTNHWPPADTTHAMSQAPTTQALLAAVENHLRCGIANTLRRTADNLHTPRDNASERTLVRQTRNTLDTWLFLREAHWPPFTRRLNTPRDNMWRFYDLTKSPPGTHLAILFTAILHD